LSGWQSRSGYGSLLGVTTASNPVWLYHCFSLSLRDVELILAARGIVVSYETIRDWGLRFGRIFATAPPPSPDCQ